MFGDVLCLVDCLGIIKSLTHSEVKIRKAEILEGEADLAILNKQNNTFYPNLPDTYLKALKEIKSIDYCDELRDRLKVKYEKELLELPKMISTVGIPDFIEPNYEQIQQNVDKEKIDSFDDAKRLLISKKRWG